MVVLVGLCHFTYNAHCEFLSMCHECAVYGRFASPICLDIAYLFYIQFIGIVLVIWCGNLSVQVIHFLWCKLRKPFLQE